MSSRLVSVFALVPMVLFWGAITALPQAPGKQRKATNYMDYATRFEIVNYDQPDNSNNVDAVRKAKNRRYDRQGWVGKNPHPETAGVGKVDELPPPPESPVDESDLIVIGRVDKTAAHLSNDRQGVYTEFDICVSETIKASPTIKIAQTGECVTADREGGRVRYPNGQIVFYANSNKGVPWPGSEWLFFLRRDGQSPNYHVITAYQNEEGTIHLLDDHYRSLEGANFSRFLTSVKNKVSGTPARNLP